MSKIVVAGKAEDSVRIFQDPSPGRGAAGQRDFPAQRRPRGPVADLKIKLGRRQGGEGNQGGNPSLKPEGHIVLAHEDDIGLPDGLGDVRTSVGNEIFPGGVGGSVVVSGGKMGVNKRGLGTHPIFTFGKYSKVGAVAGRVGVGSGKAGIAQGEIAVFDEVLCERVCRQNQRKA